MTAAEAITIQIIRFIRERSSSSAVSPPCRSAPFAVWRLCAPYTTPCSGPRPDLPPPPLPDSAARRGAFAAARCADAVLCGPDGWRTVLPGGAAHLQLRGAACAAATAAAHGESGRPAAGTGLWCAEVSLWLTGTVIVVVRVYWYVRQREMRGIMTFKLFDVCVLTRCAVMQSPLWRVGHAVI